MGKAKNLRKRVSSYFVNKSKLGEKTTSLVSQTQKIRIIIAHSELEALLLEINYIKKYKPYFNIRLTDGKAYHLIKITIKDEYPKVLLSRKKDDKKSIYFGPFPNSGAMKLVLKITRKIFPFQGVLNHPKKICLYNHLGLCPCPPVFSSPALKKDYRKNINRLIKFLNGKSQAVIKEFEKERDKESKSENFEKALDFQKKLDAVRLVTDPSYKIFSEEINPNLKLDDRIKETNELADILNENGYFLQSLKKIECYDISNISGKYAVGSMVVFINGEADKTLYRRFKIRYTKEEPNDFAMIREVIRRRFSHDGWSYPDLVIIDGGKGQVSSTNQVFKEKKLEIPVIGLAKKFETIVTSNLKEIKIPNNTAPLKLLMRIRDEAHRFAISYHRSLRSKALVSNL